jgi:hypothetical protein
VGGEAPVTPVSSPDSSFQTFPTNRAITPSSTRRSEGPRHRIFSSLPLARRALGNGSSISLLGNLHPQLTLRNSPLVFREIGLRTFVNLMVKAFVSQSPKTQKQSTLTFTLSLSDFSLSRFRWSRCRATRSFDSRNLIFPRNVDALATLTFQHPFTPSGLRTLRFRKS